jgi:hypothetical protein
MLCFHFTQLLHTGIGPILGAFAKLRKANISIIISVRLYAVPAARMEQFGYHWTDLNEI